MLLSLNSSGFCSPWGLTRTQVWNHMFIPWISALQIAGHGRRNDSFLSPSLKRSREWVYLQGWKESDLSSFLPSPTFIGQRQGLCFSHVYMVRIHAKVGSIICFIPALPGIGLRFFSCMVVDHNYSKSREATLSYHSSLRGTWFRHYISSHL